MKKIPMCRATDKIGYREAKEDNCPACGAYVDSSAYGRILDASGTDLEREIVCEECGEITRLSYRYDGFRILPKTPLGWDHV